MTFWIGPVRQVKTSWIALLTCCAAAAQQQPLTLEQAVKRAAEKYPSVRASMEQASAAAAAIGLARKAYLPRADFLGQINRATHNNVFGMLLQQPAISPISGPVLRTNSLENVWGTAAGFLVQWEPFDFGLRQANIRVAESARDRAQAETAVARLQAGTAAADAFLTLLAAQQTVRAAQAGVERARVFHQSVATLVKNELRPGAEESRTRAEVALAQNQLIQAEQAVDVSRAVLAQYLDLPAAAIAPEAGPLLQMPAAAAEPTAAAPAHPAAIAQNLAVDEAKAREAALDRQYFPKFNLQATSYARGTGVQPDGTTGNAASGLGPNIQNWGAGFTLTFPLFELPSIKARKEIELHRERAEAARYELVVRELNGQMERARAMLNGARRIAENTPVQLEAARAAEQQAGARYKAGLGTIVEVAEAQRLLTQAEIDDSLAKLNVWRALLAVAAAQGNLDGYLQTTR